MRQAEHHLVMELGISEDVALVGGKAANLGKLIRAGFPVPGGFVVTTEAFRGGLTATLEAEVVAAYRAMGEGRVAVRSSATAEDMAEASLAGQYETYLNIEGAPALLAAVRKCWESVHSDRTRAYFAEHGLDGSRVAMAAVVQRLVDAEAAGVLFTANPTTADRTEMLIEASWGLGEMVVSGKVQPDIVRLDAGTGAVKHVTIADKHVRLMPGAQDEEAVPEDIRKEACLSAGDLEKLWKLGRKAAVHFGSPQDLEWAKASGQIWLLQSRPVTTLDAVEAVTQAKHLMIDRVKADLARGRGPWVIHNLAETLPHPTPLSWSVVGRFMTGAGGYGQMYREAGFLPSDKVMREGFLELIGGRVYMDLSRGPEMFFPGFPFAYDAPALKRMPQGASSPTVAVGSAAAIKRARGQLAQAQSRLREVARTLDKELVGHVFPELAAFVQEIRKVELSSLDADALVALWTRVEVQVMGVFGAKLLLPSLVSGMALEELQAFLAEVQWEEDPAELAARLSAGGAASRTVLADEGLYQVGIGKEQLADWIKEHGHRATGEFDLAAVRWREKPEAVLPMAEALAKGESPAARHHRQAVGTAVRVARLRRTLARRDRAELDHKVELACRYMTFREDAKDVFMQGYDLLRDLALECGRRLRLKNGDVFYLNRESMLAGLQMGRVKEELVALRKRGHLAEEKLELPGFVDTQMLKELEQPKQPSSAPPPAHHTGLSVSAGKATGPVLVLRKPSDYRGQEAGYVLLCPSTDPSWTPLFANAAGLLLERGGMLSHGAVVAREMGLPAVVLADATKRFKDGEWVTVDGTRGWVGKAEEVEETNGADPEDETLPWELLPPGPSRKDKRAARVRNGMIGVWAVYLTLAFGLPASKVLEPSLELIDTALWPIVKTIGRPGTVALVAGVVALLMLVIQKLGTDNDRLVEAKRRARVLKEKAEELPRSSARRIAMERAAAVVPVRTLMAAMLPIGLLLGPMVLPFVWFKERIDPALMNAPAGTAVQVVAQVDAAYGDKIELVVPVQVSVDEATPAVRHIQSLQGKLERLLRCYREAGVTGGKAPPTPQGMSIQEAGEALERVLEEGRVPTQGVTWMVHPQDGLEGRVGVGVKAGEETVRVQVGWGDNVAPRPRSAPGSGVVKNVSATYAIPARKIAFWEVGGWDVGWPWIYLGVYVGVLLVGKKVLGVA